MASIVDHGVVSILVDAAGATNVFVSGSVSDEGPQDVFAVFRDVSSLVIDPDVAMVKRSKFKSTDAVVAVYGQGRVVHLVKLESLSVNNLLKG